MQNTVAIVLAAGQGKRMNSNLPKVAHLLLNKPLIIWVIESLISSGIKNIVPVISPSQDLVKEIIEDRNFSKDIRVLFSYQNEQLGTAHAVQCGAEVVKAVTKDQVDFRQDLKIIVAYGDTPAVKPQTFQKLIQFHTEQKNVFTLLAFKSENPYGYGRIILDKNNKFTDIREQKDCTDEEAKIQICNSGILCANFLELIAILPLIKNNNSAKEYYLTDIPMHAKKMNLKIGLMVEKEEQQFLGINTQEQLLKMENLVNKGG